MSENLPEPTKGPNPYAMDREHAKRLLEDVRAGNLKNHIEIRCDANDDDGFMVGRVGDGDDGRALVVSREGGRLTRSFVNPENLRKAAAAMLNVADEIDGTSPLVFFPREAR